MYGIAVGLSPEQLRATVLGTSQDSVWAERDRLLINLVDALHETSAASDSLWEQLAADSTPVQLIELLILVGWYQLICFVINGIQVEQEPWAMSFPCAEQERPGTKEAGRGSEDLKSSS